jgi:hypothetical protein
MTQLARVLLVTSSADPLSAAAAMIVAGVYLFYQGFRLLKRKRLILNTPASKIRSAAIGLVEINGLATGPRVISSPLRQSDCFFYRSIAWEWKQRGKKSEWVKIGEETLYVPFYVDDGTGCLLVDPRGADMDLHCDFRQEYNRSLLFIGPEMPGSVCSFLSRYGADSSRRVKVEEYCIKPKNFLFVLGTLAHNPGFEPSPTPAEAGYAVAAATPGASHPPSLQSPANVGPAPAPAITQQQRIATALVKAGITNPAAWAAAGVSPQAVAKHYSPGPVATSGPSHSGQTQSNPWANQTFDPHPPTVLMKGTHESGFFISWRSQRDLVSSLGWKASLMIWGGPALTLAGVYVLLTHFSHF